MKFSNPEILSKHDENFENFAFANFQMTALVREGLVLRIPSRRGKCGVPLMFMGCRNHTVRYVHDSDPILNGAVPTQCSVPEEQSDEGLCLRNEVPKVLSFLLEGKMHTPQKY
jgi:hypothetical protein